MQEVVQRLLEILQLVGRLFRGVHLCGRHLLKQRFFFKSPDEEYGNLNSVNASTPQGSLFRYYKVNIIIVYDIYIYIHTGKQEKMNTDHYQSAIYTVIYGDIIIIYM